MLIDYIGTGIGDHFSALLLSDGFEARTSRPKPLSALLTHILHS